jgi:hypothetical protein
MARIGEKIILRKREGKNNLEDLTLEGSNIKTGLQEIGFGA